MKLSKTLPLKKRGHFILRTSSVFIHVQDLSGFHKKPFWKTRLQESQCVHPDPRLLTWSQGATPEEEAGKIKCQRLCQKAYLAADASAPFLDPRDLREEAESGRHVRWMLFGTSTIQWHYSTETSRAKIWQCGRRWKPWSPTSKMAHFCPCVFTETRSNELKHEKLS